MDWPAHRSCFGRCCQERLASAPAQVVAVHRHDRGESGKPSGAHALLDGRVKNKGACGAECGRVLTEAGLMPISDREYRLFQQLIYQEAGIFLSDVKRALLVGRLGKRLRELGLRSFAAYYEHVQQDRSGRELVGLLDAITTNETQFFREPRQFEFLEQQVFPAWEQAAREGRRARHIRLWSAACSTGEEPYSLAMAVLDHFPPDSGWSVEILATDISTRVLERAVTGVWPITRAASIPPALLKRFMLRGTGSQQGMMKAGAAVRLPLQFERLNLNDERYPVAGPFDAIFCRNVLIYFDQASRQRVIDRLLDLLAPEGYFFLGHAESLAGMTERVHSVSPAVYMAGSARGRQGRGRA